ncbi:MAG: Tn3 family transposase [Mycobacterium sp.]
MARYLRLRGLQREINDGLNVAESWNRANSIIFYGKNAELASNRRDEQEMSVLCLRICQAAMVFINILMIQDVLADPDLGRRTHRRGRTWSDPAILAARSALRGGQT